MKRDPVSVAMFSTVVVIGTLTILAAMQTFLVGKFDPKNAVKAEQIRMEYAAKLIKGAEDSLRGLPDGDEEVERVRLSLHSAHQTLARKFPERRH